MSDFIKRPYPDNWPWSLPHQHPEGDTPPPFEGFNPDVPESGTAVSNLAQALREAKVAYNSVVSVPAVFSCDVEDGDIVIPLPCGDSCDVNCDELLKTLRDLGQIPDAIWVPAFRTSTDSQVSTLSAVDPTTYDPPFYGVAYTKLKRVMVGPVVAHPRYKFHTGDKIYAGTDGDLTTTENGSMIGVCLAPGSIFLLQYASSLKTAMEDLYSNAVKDTIEKIEQEGLDGDKIGVTTDGTTLERPLEIRFGDVVNVKDFGAKGDGKTNDTNAFNLAIARAQQLGSNVCLFIPVGTYLVTTLPNVPCYGPGSIKYNGYTYSPFELLFKLNGAIQKDTNGRYKVDFTKMSEADLAALIKQLLPSTGGGLTTDEDGKLVVDFTQMSKEELKEMIESLLPDTGGGLTTDEDGKLVLDFSQLTPTQKEDLISQIVQEGGGLSVDENGQIYVDFDSMPTDKFEAMLKSIRVPIWLTKNMTIYVATTGSDTLDEGRGLSPDKPFASIKAAVDYVSTTYNLYNYDVTINVEPGDYGRGLITLPSYSTTTGEIIIIGQSQNPDDIVCGRFLLEYASKYSLYNMTVHPNDITVGIVGAIEASSGTIRLYNIKLRLRNVSTGSGALWGVYTRANGFIQIWATQSLDQLNGVIFDCSGATIAGLILATSAKIEFAADLSVLGDATMSITTVRAQQNGSIVRSRSSYSNPGRLPNIIVEGTVTGQRYSASMNGIISVAKAGPEFWPGSSEGITVTGGQYT